MIVFVSTVYHGKSASIMAAIAAVIGAAGGVAGVGTSIAAVLPTHRECRLEITNATNSHRLTDRKYVNLNT